MFGFADDAGAPTMGREWNSSLSPTSSTSSTPMGSDGARRMFSKTPAIWRGRHASCRWKRGSFTWACSIMENHASIVLLRASMCGLCP